MKKLFYRLFKPHVYKCAYNIKLIREDKRERILQALRYINKWDDMPVSFIGSSIADILKIQYDRGGQWLVLALMSPWSDLDKLQNMLPYNKNLPFK